MVRKRTRQWAQAFDTDTWHLAYDHSPTLWTAECRAFSTVKTPSILLKRSTLRAHPKEPTCQRCLNIAVAYAEGRKR